LGSGSWIITDFGNSDATGPATRLAWRTGAGALNLKEVGETSAVLGWPVWLAQMLMVPSFALLALAGFYLAWHRLGIALRHGEVARA
jgi:TRAP-type mannitol/chloroaromatic compound transport system permease small subunit